ncbi:MAG: type II toxin-antitoxin system HicA family toxin [Deltaproteobacteria bacterium]|nr:type II toxin-antitoxin system HicA family toxin [Deltaproteobacteria bacterium]
MNGNELLKKLKKIAKDRKINIVLIKSRGKGSHGTLYFGGKKTIFKDPKKEIGPGLLKAILERLGLEKKDVE